MRLIWVLSGLSLVFICNLATSPFKLLVIKEKEDQIWGEQTDPDLGEVQIVIDRNDLNSTKTKVCNALKSGVTAVLDMTWTQQPEVKLLCDGAGVPYIAYETGIQGFIRAAERTLTLLNDAPNVAFIFQNEESLDQSLYYFIRESSLRVILFPKFEPEEANKLFNMRPTPSFIVVLGDTPTITRVYKQAVESNLVKLDDRWLLVFTDNEYKTLNDSLFKKRTITFKSPIPINSDVAVVEQVKIALKNAVKETMETAGNELNLTIIDCDQPSGSPLNRKTLSSLLQKEFNSSDSLTYNPKTSVVGPHLSMELRSESPTGPSKPIGFWNSSSGLTKPDNITKVRRFFRVATGYMIPFGYPGVDEFGAVKMSEDGIEQWEGYCIDLINKLSQEMDFDYELTTTREFGKKLPNGSWTGLVGMLATGRVDIVVAPFTMTSEREEVIDFVAPYFEQTGFSIVIRKPLRKTSLFKFMTVLRVEVWFSILAALCLTAVMIWFLDKYSPYSARNNKSRYPHECREFTLRESFWFAVTSFTPQGGGEAPKALSSRTLVAAYWLFVVLMLATFTANLAAFLTVERMQSPVQSLKQLARQSRINYTVVNGSDAHQYFRNMKNAEETLYRVWKEITLNATVDQSQYRVWDYPIQEQYSHILIAIEKTGTVSGRAEGFRKVRENEDAEFALIHDALQIKYEVYKDCNLTEIGEPFAEQPYAIAVQQGSHLNEEISRRILDLQKDRYFEGLTAKYWNASIKNKCDSYDEDEGITLESLGGVFIATLFGLLLALITLGVEVLYQKKKKSKINRTSPIVQKNPFFQGETHFIKEFGHRVTNRGKMPKMKPTITYISSYPRDQLI